jgi:hypothetical protein
VDWPSNRVGATRDGNARDAGQPKTRDRGGAKGHDGVTRPPGTLAGSQANPGAPRATCIITRITDRIIIRIIES